MTFLEHLQYGWYEYCVRYCRRRGATVVLLEPGEWLQVRRNG